MQKISQEIFLMVALVLVGTSYMAQAAAIQGVDGNTTLNHLINKRQTDYSSPGFSPGCLPDYRLCNINSDCCYSNCVGGYCRGPTPTCTNLDGACNPDADRCCAGPSAFYRYSCCRYGPLARTCRRRDGFGDPDNCFTCAGDGDYCSSSDPCCPGFACVPVTNRVPCRVCDPLPNPRPIDYSPRCRDSTCDIPGHRCARK